MMTELFFKFNSNLNQANLIPTPEHTNFADEGCAMALRKYLRSLTSCCTCGSRQRLVAIIGIKKSSRTHHLDGEVLDVVGTLSAVMTF